MEDKSFLSLDATRYTAVIFATSSLLLRGVLHFSPLHSGYFFPDELSYIIKNSLHFGTKESKIKTNPNWPNNPSFFTH